MEPFTVTVYNSSGACVAEEDFRSAFEANVSGQRLSDDRHIAVVKDRRSQQTKLMRVWINGRSAYCTPHCRREAVEEWPDLIEV